VVPGCAAVFRGDDVQDVLGQVVVHAGHDHPDLELTPEAETSVRDAIHAD
jgi:predicted small metal-binding protein